MLWNDEKDAQCKCGMAGLDAHGAMISFSDCFYIGQSGSFPGQFVSPKAVLYFDQKEVALLAACHADEPFRVRIHLFTSMDGVVERVGQDDTDVNVPDLAGKRKAQRAGGVDPYTLCDTQLISDQDVRHRVICAAGKR